MLLVFFMFLELFDEILQPLDKTFNTTNIFRGNISLAEHVLMPEQMSIPAPEYQMRRHQALHPRVTLSLW